MMTWCIYIAAALAEIAGCFSFWAWLRLEQTALWLMPGVASLVLFAYLLTLVESSHAGRAYAAYGGIYITASLLWLWLIEETRPTLTDVAGSALCLLGAMVIILGAKAAQAH